MRKVEIKAKVQGKLIVSESTIVPQMPELMGDVRRFK